MSTVKTDQVLERTADAGVTIDGVLIKDDVIKIPGGSPGAGKLLQSDADGNASWVAGGKILQVLQATKTDTQSSTTNDFVDVTGLSIAITPAATSSKILVFANVLCIGTVAGTAAFSRVVRDSTAIAIADADGSRTRASAMGYAPDTGDVRHHSTVWLDSPSTTSATTYKIQFMMASAGSTAYINRFAATTDSAAYGRGVSSITVMEVSA